jgi:hypothetical protein
MMLDLELALDGVGVLENVARKAGTRARRHGGSEWEILGGAGAVHLARGASDHQEDAGEPGAVRKWMRKRRADSAARRRAAATADCARIQAPAALQGAATLARDSQIVVTNTSKL